MKHLVSQKLISIINVWCLECFKGETEALELRRSTNEEAELTVAYAVNGLKNIIAKSKLMSSALEVIFLLFTKNR